MKTILSLAIITLGMLNLSAQPWMDAYDQLLERYVTSDGVKYKKLKAENTETLNIMTQWIAHEKPSGTKQDQLAFYLNAYNIWMLKKVIDVYPTDSLLENDENVYKREDIVVSGKKMSLDFLENGIIRKQFGDARIHFAINCASVGCPPLLNRAFRGKTLDTDLHKVTGTFLNSKQGVVEQGGELKVSKLFEWFAVDFKKDAGSVVNYIKKYRPISSDKVSYLDYSWKLNEG